MIAVYFDRNRKVQRLAEYGMKDGHVFDFVSQTTPTSGNDLNVITTIIHNLEGKGTLSLLDPTHSRSVAARVRRPDVDLSAPAPRATAAPRYW